MGATHSSHSINESSALRTSGVLQSLSWEARAKAILGETKERPGRRWDGYRVDGGEEEDGRDGRRLREVRVSQLNKARLAEDNFLEESSHARDDLLKYPSTD